MFVAVNDARSVVRTLRKNALCRHCVAGVWCADNPAARHRRFAASEALRTDAKQAKDENWDDGLAECAPFNGTAHLEFHILLEEYAMPCERRLPRAELLREHDFVAEDVPGTTRLLGCRRLQLNLRHRMPIGASVCRRAHSYSQRCLYLCYECCSDVLMKAQTAMKEDAAGPSRCVSEALLVTSCQSSTDKNNSCVTLRPSTPPRSELRVGQQRDENEPRNGSCWCWCGSS